MKKYIFAEIALLFSIALYLYFLITRIETAISYLNYPPNPDLDYLEMYSQLGMNNVITACLCAVALIGNIFVFLILLIKFKPLADKLKARKQAREAEKAEKAEADKQARIAELQAELEELKKD